MEGKVMGGESVTITQTPGTESVQQEAARLEIKQIQTRNHIRGLQLQQAVQLYAKLKIQSEIYTYKNQFKTTFVQQNSLQIIHDIFVDHTAEQQRFEALKLDF